MRSGGPVSSSAERRKLILRALLVFAAICVAALAFYAPSMLRAAAVLSASIDMYDPSGLTTLVSHDVRTEELALRLPDRALRDRRYRPDGVRAPPVALVLHGVHPRGIDEPRLQAFARALASVGLEVHTPELPELAAFHAEPRLITDIAHCAAALQRAHGQQRVGAFGISFAGGLLLLAAASREGDAALDYVVALGAHDDMRRLARFYAGSPIAGPPGGEAYPAPPKAHPYGGRILASWYATDLFGAEADVARRALTLHLQERYREAKALRAQLSAPARSRFDAVLGEPTPALQPVLLAAAQRHGGELASLSPAGKLAGLRVPVFLVHGTGDPVVPSSETAWLARDVPKRALRRVLITPALRHAEGSGAPTATDGLRLVAFLAAVLREAGR
jgi:dienelactone hydrolase